MGPLDDDKKNENIPNKSAEPGASPAKAEAAAESLKIESPSIAPAQEAAKAEAVMAAPPKIEPKIEIPAASIKTATATRDAKPFVLGSLIPAALLPGTAHLRALRMSPLAATVAIAAGIGAMAGALGTLGIANLLAAPSQSAALDNHALNDAIARIGSDVASLKAGVDNSAKTTSLQFGRLAERLERSEKAQAEPAAKIAKIAEALDRRTQSAAAAPNQTQGATADVTGSIARPQPMQQTAPPMVAKDESRPIIAGWLVRAVRDGTALIESRQGLIEVEVGDPLPGGGVVQAIRRQDGRWIVITSKGLVVSQR